MAKDILKEAIADAKAVREVALANAKAALEEAFTPKLQNMLSAKLSEDLDETYYDEDEKDMDEMNMYDEDEKDMEEMMYDEDEKDMEEVKKDDEKMEEANLDEEIDLEEILNELELEEAEDSKDKKVDEVKDKDDKDSMEEAKDDDDKKMEEAKHKDEKDSMEEAKDDKEKMEEEEQLDEMGKPIYNAEYANDPTYKADHVHEDQDFDLDALLEEINNLDEKKDDDEVNESEEVVNETEDTNEVVGTALAGIGGLVAAAGGVAKLKMAAEDPAFKEKYPKIASMLDKLQDMGSAAGSAMRRENEEMAEELEETKKALETVSKELNEVNLLNSKLLYVNRIFKANTLDDAQKLRVVETLDKADSTKEAKLIYETIKDSFSIAKTKKVSKRTTRKPIKENFRKGIASKASGVSRVKKTAPKRAIISESDNMVNRFQKLANIKINE